MDYTSELRLFGLPWVQIRIGAPGQGRGIARAWIAIGDVAFGVLFAVGGAAIGGIAIGGLSLGVLGLGGLAIGGWAVGGLALGYAALGGAAIALTKAEGGLAIAGALAQGGKAIAPHANDAFAAEVLAREPLFRVVRPLLRWAWVLVFLPVILLPLLLRNRRTRPPAGSR